MTFVQKFTLGTANLGTRYGITNNDDFDVNLSLELLSEAIDLGVISFDTAPDYGVAEELLGKCLENQKQQTVVTKIPRMPAYDYANIRKSLESSLKKLGKETIHGVLFHDPKAYLYPDISRISEEVLNSGMVEKIGFSAYDEEDLIRAKEMCPNWTIFQIQENIADRRKFHSTQLNQLALEGNSIHVRSVFLQGLLIQRYDKIPIKFEEIYTFNKMISNFAKELGVEPRDICLSYTNRIKWAESTIIGAATRHQLVSNLNYSDIQLDFDSLPTISSSLLDPRNWEIL